MQFKFNPALAYQQQAISAVVDIFAGQPVVHADFETSTMASSGIKPSELGIANQFAIDEADLICNIQTIQQRNQLQQSSDISKSNLGYQFSIEMETGTGKTYVYLRTIFELSRKYGFKKFIIIVPSIAIRCGVVKSIEMMTAHFRKLYNNMPVNYCVYDAKQLSKVRQFANSNQLQIMIINIQSFQRGIADKETAKMTIDELRKLNIINRENDSLSGHKPIDFIQATQPVAIIDEPQSVANTEKAQRALARLKPLITLRYSATHLDVHNLLYKLDPVKAYDLRLVKRIEVASIRSDDSFNQPYVKLIKTDNKNGIKALVEIDKVHRGSIRKTKLWLQQDDDLYEQSGQWQYYQAAYIIRTIDSRPGDEYIEFSNGVTITRGQATGDYRDAIMQAQIKETIVQHLNKEQALKGRNIKVLSLFFIDRVANYRMYHDNGTPSLGKIGKWFEDAYRELTQAERYREFATNKIANIHGGYFSQDKKTKQWQNTTGHISKDDETYQLIMQDKERLLDPNEPLRFIFSHSALREGWDNPNVFQICTLSESQSVYKKRQEIGRGLRLPVNATGERVYDDSINRLTIIANESYEDFASQLQTEFEQDLGIKFGQVEKTSFATIIDSTTGIEIGQASSLEIWQGLLAQDYIDKVGNILAKFDPQNPHFELTVAAQYVAIKPQLIDRLKHYLFKNRVINVKEQRTLRLNKQVQLSDDFIALWDKIKQRTRYSVHFDTHQLITEAAQQIKSSLKITAASIRSTRVDLKLSAAGFNTDNVLEHGTKSTITVNCLPDLLAVLQQKTRLTRSTLVAILQQSETLEKFRLNPQQFIDQVSDKITQTLHQLILSGVQYQPVANHYWQMCRIEQQAAAGIKRYLNSLYQVNNTHKTLFDYVELDSEVERQFAKDLDNNTQVRLFVKLPSWFKIDTPVGAYNPDWAFVTNGNDRLYFVRETKSSTASRSLRQREQDKIICGRNHFDAIGVDYDVVTKLQEVNFE